MKRLIKEPKPILTTISFFFFGDSFTKPMARMCVAATNSRSALTDRQTEGHRFLYLQRPLDYVRRIYK